MAIERQALANLIAKFTYSNTVKVIGIANNTEAAKVARVRENENSVPTEWDAK